MKRTGEKDMQLKPEKSEAEDLVGATASPRPAADLTTSVENERLPYSRRENIFTMLGVLFVVFFAMLDQTIVVKAIPRIVSDLQGFYRITWVTTAFLLTSTVPFPI